MADYTVRRETTQRIIVTLRLPTNVTELHKAIHGMQQELGFRSIPIFDDTIEVNADDEEIRFVAEFAKENE